jgi:hypothetical protein
VWHSFCRGKNQSFGKVARARETDRKYGAGGRLMETEKHEIPLRRRGQCHRQGHRQRKGVAVQMERQRFAEGGHTPRQEKSTV